MKMNVSKKCTEQKSGRNNDRKYGIRGFKCHLSGAVSVAVYVAGVIGFVLLMR